MTMTYGLLQMIIIYTAIFIDIYYPINKFYSVIIFSLLINAVQVAVELSCFNISSLHTFSSF